MEMIFESQWSTYEEWGAIKIFEDSSGKFYAQDGGHSVYSLPSDPEWNEPYEISLQDALDLIDEWDEIEKEYENYVKN